MADAAGEKKVCRRLIKRPVWKGLSSDTYYLNALLHNWILWASVFPIPL